MDLRNADVFQKQEALLLNPLQLAYLGDTVWETMIRYELIRKRLNVHHMHQECVKKVNAQAQAAGQATPGADAQGNNGGDDDFKVVDDNK